MATKTKKSVTVSNKELMSIILQALGTVNASNKEMSVPTTKRYGFIVRATKTNNPNCKVIKYPNATMPTTINKQQAKDILADIDGFVNAIKSI